MSYTFDAKTSVDRLGKGDFDGQLDNELTKLSQEQLWQVAALLPKDAHANLDLSSNFRPCTLSRQ
jgi:hypothetical protein